MTNLYRMRQLLYLLCLLVLPIGLVRAQDSTHTDPTDAEEVVISPEAQEAGPDSGKAAYIREAAERRDTLTYAAANDRRPVQVRSVDEKQLESIRSDRAYQYGIDVPPTASMWDRIWAWFWQQFSNMMETRAYRNVGQYVLLVGLAALVVWLLYKAEVLKRLFPGRASALPLDYTLVDEDIHAINFADRIDEAVSQRNYRLAVRLLYLQTLKHLTDRGLISWQPNKTNRQYTYELTGNPVRLPFEQLTTQFEYIWYGDFPVDEHRFQLIRQAFTQFNAS